MKRISSQRHVRFVAVLLVSLVFAIRSGAQAPLQMSFSTQRALPDRWMGYDGQNTVRNGMSWAEPNLVAHWPEVHPKVIRFPGNSGFYDWERGWFIDSTILPVKLANYSRQPNYLENFKVVLDLTGAKALITLNMVSKDLANQLRMLKHADSIGIDVAYLELGSEFYLDPANNDDLGEGVDLIVELYPTARHYAETCKVWIDSIKYYFPDAKISVIGSYVKTSAGRRATWNDSVRTYLNGKEDAWTFHIYQPASTYVNGYAVDSGISMAIVPDMLNQPGRAFEILTQYSMPKITAGKEVWLTEYNLLDPGRPLQGRWMHGLYMGLMTMRMLEIDRITNMFAHTFNGSAIFGQFFDSEEGFTFSETAGENYTVYENPPLTTEWGLTASGHATKMISDVSFDKTTVSQLSFDPNPQVVAHIEALDSNFYYDAIYGWNFSNEDGSDALLMNLSDVPYDIITSGAFPGGGTYSMKHANPLTLVANDDSLAIVTNAGLPDTLRLEPYSITRISSNLVPLAPPVVQISSNGGNEICSGDSVELDAGEHAFYVWSNGARTRKIWASETGDYWVRSSDSVAGFWGGDTLHLTVNPLPEQPNILLTGSLDFCFGDTTILNPNNIYHSSIAFQWNSGETTRSKNATESGNYYLTVTDSNGCVSTSLPKNIIVHPLPAPTIQALGPTEFCHDQNVTLSAPEGYLSYQWNNNKNGQTVTQDTTGIYWVSVKDSNLCWGESVNTISLTSWEMVTPTIVVNGGPSSYCAGTPVYLSTVSDYSYQWQVANSNISGATNLIHTPASGGSYKVITTDSHGCSKTSAAQQITIWNNPVPNVTVTGGTAICEGQSTTLSASNTTYIYYNWSTGATTTAITTAEAGTYVLTVTDGNGCVGSSDPRVITVNPLPSPTISAGGAVEFCSGSNVVLSVNQTYSSYAWSPSGFGQTKTANTSGTYQCTVTDVNGCQGTSNSITVDVHSLPTPTVNSSSGSGVFCSNAGVYLTTPVTGYNYQWLKGSVVQNGATNQNFYPTSTGNYKVRISDALGCTAVSGLYSTTVNTPPAPSITGSTAICNGSSTSLSANTTYTTYAWSTGATTQTVSVNTPGTYSLTVTNTNGCSGTTSANVQEVNAIIPTVSASGPVEFCEGGTVVLNVTPIYSSYLWSDGKITASNTVGVSGNYSVTVTDANGCTAISSAMNVNEHILPDPLALSSTGSATFCSNVGAYLTTDAIGYSYQWIKGVAVLEGATNQNYLNPTSGTYKVQIIDNIGCSETSSPVSFTVNTSPAPSITGATIICGSNPVTISANTTYLTYLWSNGATTQSATITTPGTYTLTVSDVNGCTGTASRTITAGSAATPVISASGATEFCDGGSVVLSITPSFSSYLWSDGKITSTNTVNASGSYSVTVTDANGCTATSSAMSVNEHILTAPAVISSSGSSTWCTGESVYLTTDAVGYTYQWFKGSTSQSGATNQNFTPTTSGSYKVRITDNIGCTKTSSLYSVTINSSLTPTIAGTPVICNGASTLLSANNPYATYSWSNGETGQAITVTQSGTYTLTVTNSSGCSGSASVTVTTGSITVPSLSASGATEFCSGSNVVLSTSPASYTTYLWSDGKTTATNTVTSSGNYTCTVTNSSGCSATTSPVAVNVHVLTQPVVTTSSGTTTYCSNSGVYLTTASAGYNYQWYKGSTLQTGATNQNFSPTVSGSYKVKITDNIGCNSTSSLLSITINTAPAPSITGNTAVCDGSSTTLSANTNYATYLWSTGATTQSVTVSSAGTYSLTVSNTNGCTATTSKTVTAGSATVPVISASGATEFCSGGNVTLSTVPSTYSSYLWSDGKITSTNLVNASGDYSVIVTDASGCTAVSSPMNVNVHTLETPVVTTSSGSTTYCNNSGVYLTTAATGYNYQWFKGSASQSGATNQNYSPTASGSYKVRITDNIGCSKTSALLSITINTATIPSITGGELICNGNSVALSANNVYSNYLWSTGETTQSISVSTPGTYSLTITNTSGCNGTASTTVSEGSATTPAIVASGPTEFCSGGSVTLSTSPASYASYSWSNNKTTATNSITSSGSYTVTVTDASGCTATSAAMIVDVHSVSTPVVTSSNGISTFCANSGIYLTTASSGYNYQWQKGITVLTGETNQNYFPSSTGNYKVKITDNIGCSATSASYSVTVNPAPSPTITGAATICEGSAAVISAGMAYPTYAWSTGASSQSISITEAGTYSLTVTDAAGCSGSISKTMSVSVRPAPWITASGATSFCDGGNVNLSANPVSSSYSWSSGQVMQSITASSSGSYTVTVTDANGCTGTSTAMVVTEHPVPSTTITPVGLTTFCSGDVSNYLSGPGGYSYQWKKGSADLAGATNQTYVPTSTGTYKLATTDGNGCSATSATGVTITVNNLPNATASASGSLNICSGQTKTLNANTGVGLTYQWKKDGVTIEGAVASSYVASIAGAYTVVVTNSFLCSKTSNELVITSNCKTDGESILELPAISTIELYPNPATDQIHVSIEFAGQDQGQAVIEIRDAVGQLMMVEKAGVTSGKLQMNILIDQQYASGIYFLRAILNEESVLKRFVIANKGD